MALIDETTEKIDLSSIGWECGFLKNNIGNFSLVPVGNENYLASFRVFGFYIDGKGRYLTHESMKLERPDEHLFVLLDRNFNFVRRLELKVNTYYVPDEFVNSRTYLEDMRLVKWEGEIYGISSTFYLNSERWDKMGLEVQKISLDIDNGEVFAEHVWNNVESGVGGEREKNWMPVPDKPFTFISQILDSNGEMLRGNTPLVKVDDGYITITHKVINEPGKVKEYQNFFVRLDDGLNVVGISRPFKICESNIEFITCLMRKGDDWWIGDTSNDDTPFLYKVNTTEDLTYEVQGYNVRKRGCF